MVVCEYLQLGVQVQGEVDEPRESSGRMARWEGLETVVDGVFVASADAAVVHDARPAGAGLGAEVRDGRVADREEVRAEAADEAFDHDLEDGGGDEGVEQAEDGVVDVPEGADADLHEEDDDDGDEGGEQGCGPDWDDFSA